MLTSLVCIATMIIKIPSPLNGYLNLGDCTVLLSGWMLSPLYGFLAAGIGSALADLFSGYVLYAPATFLIKGVMALAAHGIFKMLRKKHGALSSEIISGACAEAVMISGYFSFEAVLYGPLPSAVNLPANLLQGVVGMVLGIALIKFIKKAF